MTMSASLSDDADLCERNKETDEPARYGCALQGAAGWETSLPVVLVAWEVITLIDSSSLPKFFSNLDPMSEFVIEGLIGLNAFVSCLLKRLNDRGFQITVAKIINWCLCHTK